MKPYATFAAVLYMYNYLRSRECVNGNTTLPLMLCTLHCIHYIYVGMFRTWAVLLILQELMTVEKCDLNT